MKNKSICYMQNYYQQGEKMEKNIGTSDRIFRLAAGLAIIIIGLGAKSRWGLIGIPFPVTAFWGTCLAYIPFGINTCTLDKK